MVAGVFASTNDLSSTALGDSLSEAVAAAKLLAETKKKKVTGLAEATDLKGLFKTRVKGNLARC